MSYYTLCPTIHCIPLNNVSHFTSCPTLNCVPLFIVSHYTFCPTMNCVPLYVVSHYSLYPTIHFVTLCIVSHYTLYPTFIVSDYTLCPIFIVSHYTLYPTIHCVPLYMLSHYALFPMNYTFCPNLHFVPLCNVSHYAMCPTIHFVPLSLCPPMHCVPLYIVNRECPPLNEGLLEITTKVQLRSSLSWCWTCTARYRSSSSFILSMGSLSAVSTGKNFKGVFNVISSFSDKKNKQCLDFLSGIWRLRGRGGVVNHRNLTDKQRSAFMLRQ